MNTTHHIINIVAGTIVTIALLALIARGMSDDHQATMAEKENETALAMAKLCGTREWIVFWEHAPKKARHLKCHEKR